MKKIQIIEAVIDFFASDQAGEQKAVVHPEIVKIHLNNVFNQIIYNTWLNGKKFSDFSQLDAWSRVYTVDILNQCLDKAHCFLPFAPVQLPDGMGIRQIKDHYECSDYGEAIGGEWLLAPVEATANSIFNELEVGTMDDYPVYHLEQNDMATGAGEKSHILRLEKLPLPPNEITELDVMMIVSPEQQDDFDDLCIPAGGEDTIIRQIIDLISRKPRPDTANDQVIQSNK